LYLFVGVCGELGSEEFEWILVVLFVVDVVHSPDDDLSLFEVSILSEAFVAVDLFLLNLIVRWLLKSPLVFVVINLELLILSLTLIASVEDCGIAGKGQSLDRPPPRAR
jgi:hypothetical protein